VASRHDAAVAPGLRGAGLKDTSWWGALAAVAVFFSAMLLVTGLAG
jgi:hypothetical protein